MFKILGRVEECLNLVMRSVQNIRIGSVQVRTSEALHRNCAQDIVSTLDVPNYNRSAVDGYAVISNDVLSSSISNPIRLKIVQELFADSSPNKAEPLFNGSASVVYTGAPIPSNSDAIVMLEDTKMDEPSFVSVHRPVAPFQNVSRKGEDFEKGSVVIEKGTLIRPWHIAALLSVGQRTINVQKKIRVGVLSTGNELKDLNQKSKKLVTNTTKPLLVSLIDEEFCRAVDVGTVQDQMEAIRIRILEALQNCDILITTGGTSIGRTDLVSDSICSIEGSSILFHGVKMRPGRPTGVALVRNKPVFMLSGYPVAAFTGFEVFVKPVLNHMKGSKPYLQPIVRASLTRRLAKPVGVKAFVRVNVRRENDGRYSVEPMRLTGSGLLSTLTRSNGFLVMDEELEGHDEGENVDIVLFQPL